MEINSTGIKKSDITDYLGFWTTKLREKYGINFNIKKEGFIDNIAVASSTTNMKLEDVIMSLAKQFNPYTAEGEFQDQLYAKIGLVRRYASFTITQRTINGTAGTICQIGSIRFKNKATDDIFVLNSAVTLDSNGQAKGSFTAIELGAIELEGNAELEIIDAPDGIISITFDESSDITVVGDDYEDDAEFRARWLINQSRMGSATEGGLEAALLPLVNYNKNNLKIRQNRSTQDYLDMPLHTLEIIINTPESNEKVATTIKDNITDGVGMFGSISYPVKDSVGTDMNIKFSRANLVNISFQVQLVLMDGFYLTQVTSAIKQAIYDNFSYQMGEMVVANDYYQYINAIDGVDYVTSLKIKKTNGSWVDVIKMQYNELPKMDDINDVYISESEV